MPGDIVAFVGAGGKSSAILALVRELSETGVPVLVVPTTKMFLEEVEGIGPLMISEDLGDLRAAVEAKLQEAGAVAAGSGLLSKGRVGGVEPEWVTGLAPSGGVTLVEADGSRRRPLKGTAEHEPLLPGAATLVVAVAGIGALGQPVDEEYVHRARLFSELTGVGAGHSITAEAFATALARGSLKKIPEGARRAVLLANVTPGPSMSDASIVARALWRTGVQTVVFSSLPKENPGQFWIP